MLFSIFTWQAQRYPDHHRAPFPMCFTPSALLALLSTVGNRAPETGAKGFGPADFMGFDRVEFDRKGSKSDCGIYKPDVIWGARRQKHHLYNDPIRLWTGDAHSHPRFLGTPSPRVEEGKGDLGYVEAAFEANEWMQWFLLPILTLSPRVVIIHPWIVRRSPFTLFTADVQVCRAEDFPKREFNPAWEGHDHVDTTA
jgi:hypothetical protein